MGFLTKGKQRRELQRLAADKVRDEKLNHIILNPSASAEKKKQASKPCDVEYRSVL